MVRNGRMLLSDLRSYCHQECRRALCRFARVEMSRHEGGSPATCRVALLS